MPHRKLTAAGIAAFVAAAAAGAVLHAEVVVAEQIGRYQRYASTGKP